MLPVHLRLKKSQDFERVRSGGAVWRGKHLKLNAMPTQLPYSRFGFVVNRRVGNAVTRNKVKRRLRAAVSALLPEIKTGYDIVVISHPATSEIPYNELEASLGKLLELACLVNTKLNE